MSFVGSTPIAKYVYATATANGKRCQAMGGAKNHMLILPDADLEDVANALMGAAYGSAGERCMAISVGVCVGDEVADRLIEILKPRVEALRIGASLDTGLEMGPLVTREHREKVMNYIQMAEDEGSRLVVDGRDFVCDGHEQGFSSAARWSITSNPKCSPTRKKSSARYCKSCASAHSKKARRWRPIILTVTALRFSPSNGAAARNLRRQGRGRHGRHQCADPGAARVSTVSVAGRIPPSAITTSTAWKACAFTPRSKPSPRAGSIAASTPSSPCRY